MALAMAAIDVMTAPYRAALIRLAGEDRLSHDELRQIDAEVRSRGAHLDDLVREKMPQMLEFFSD